MRIAVFLMVLVYAISFGQQKHTIAVLPSIGDFDTKKLSAKELDFLTEKVREVIIKTLPNDEFTLLKQSAVIDRIGEEELFRACKEGSCIGDLAKKINVDYAARCEVFTLNDKFVLKFELYRVKGDATLGTFSDYANDIDDMRKMIEEKMPTELKQVKPKTNEKVLRSTAEVGQKHTVEEKQELEVQKNTTEATVVPVDNVYTTTSSVIVTETYSSEAAVKKRRTAKKTSSAATKKRRSN